MRHDAINVLIHLSLQWNHNPKVGGSNPCTLQKRLLAGRHCRLAEPGRPTGSSPRILCFEHLEGTCTPAGRPRAAAVKDAAANAGASAEPAQSVLDRASPVLRLPRRACATRCLAG